MYIGSDHIQSFLENRETVKIDKKHRNSLKVIMVDDVQDKVIV